MRGEVVVLQVSNGALRCNVGQRATWRSAANRLLSNDVVQLHTNIATAVALIRASVANSPSWLLRRDNLQKLSDSARYLLSEDVRNATYYRVGRYLCTDAFLTEFMVAILEPGDNGAKRTIELKMHANDRVYLPRGSAFFS